MAGGLVKTSPLVFSWRRVGGDSIDPEPPHPGREPPGGVVENPSVPGDRSHHLPERQGSRVPNPLRPSPQVIENQPATCARQPAEQRGAKSYTAVYM
jgi:hypothetical protein